MDKKVLKELRNMKKRIDELERNQTASSYYFGEMNLAGVVRMVETLTKTRQKKEIAYPEIEKRADVAFVVAIVALTCGIIALCLRVFELFL